MSHADSARFGKYRLLQRIAAGGMGEVHLAKLKGPSGFEKLVVIKRLLDHRQREQKYIDMFFSEARVAAQLNHSNIVQVYEVGNYDGVHYIAMEYVAGKSLRKIIDACEARHGHMPPGFVVQVIEELCAGLAFAHEARHMSGALMGLIHRDVNPHNVLVSYHGEVKIIDFGIAKSELSLEQTQAGTIKGTVVYMSPEQSSGHKLDRRSDLFSVGICMMEALTGDNPFHKDTLAASLEAIRRAAYPPPEFAQPELLPLMPVLRRALARLPAERYQDAAAFGGELRALVEAGRVPRPSQSFASFMHGLFADDISAEERLLSQTELAELPQRTETLGEHSLAALGDELTAAAAPADEDGGPLMPPPTQRPHLGEEPTLAQGRPGGPPAARPASGAARAVSSPNLRPATALGATAPAPPPPATGPAPTLPQGPVDAAAVAPPPRTTLWQRTPVRYAVGSILVLVSYLVLSLLMRPRSTAQLPHTELPAPPTAPPTAGPEGAAGAPGPTGSAVQPSTGSHLPGPGPLADAAPLAEAARDPAEGRGLRGAARRLLPGALHRHLAPPRGRRSGSAPADAPPEHEPPAGAPSATSLGSLQFGLDPPVRVLLNGAPAGSNARLRSPTGTLTFGTGTSPQTDPFTVRVHYRIEARGIAYDVEADPWADVFGAGGIRLGRTPLRGVEGGNVTVLELRNPKEDARARITLRFVGP